MTIARDLRQGIREIDRAFAGGRMQVAMTWHPWDHETYDDAGRPVYGAPVQFIAVVEDKETETLAPDGNRIPASAKLTIPRPMHIQRNDDVTLGDRRRTVVKVDTTRAADGVPLYQEVFLA